MKRKALLLIVEHQFTTEDEERFLRDENNLNHPYASLKREKA